jgi:hypothetical protein
MSSTLDELVATATQTGATVARTWIQAANAVLIGWLDVPDVESGRSSFNQGFVLVPAQQSVTPLSPESFSNWDDKKLDNGALKVNPAEVEAGKVTEMIVSVQPPKGTASGTYTGSLYDPTGTCVVEEVGVYVVGDKAP